MRSYIAAFVLAVALVFSSLSSAGQNFITYSYLNSTASFIAKRQVTIRCLTEEETLSDNEIYEGADAYVSKTYGKDGKWHPVNFAVFKYGLCEELLNPVLMVNYAWAIVVLIHESAHMKGKAWSNNEAKTQCWAMKHFKGIAYRLGNVDLQTNNRLYAYALMWHSQLPSIYHNNCSLAPARVSLYSPSLFFFS